MGLRMLAASFGMAWAILLQRLPSLIALCEDADPGSIEACDVRILRQHRPNPTTN
jgi:hypothetical protein